MNIKSIETKQVTEQPFKGLVEIEGEFEPYFETTIRYTEPRDGEREDRVYSVTGRGETEYASEQKALENLRGEMAAKVYSAYEKFMAENGAGNLDIA
jgi:hypothetical protein